MVPLNWWAQANNLFGLTLVPGEGTSQRTALEAIVSLAHAEGAKPVLVATGPLTNIAEGLRENRALCNRRELVDIVGGALK